MPLPEMPRLGLGTWKLQGEACRRVVAEALELGYRHIDTAQGYENEADVGRGIADAGLAREELFLTTKVWPDHLVRDPKVVDGSLERLGVEQLDLLLLHWPSPAFSVEQTADALAAVLTEGKTRAIGVSNYPIALLERALAHAPIAANQIECHPYLDQRPLLDACAAHRVDVTAYCPLAHGLVGSDPVLREIATGYGVTPYQLALAWLLHEGGVSAVAKASSVAHLRANMDALQLRVREPDRARIKHLSCGWRLIDPEFAPPWD